MHAATESRDADPAPAQDEPGRQGPDPKLEARLSRSAARLAAVQALYQIEITGAGWRAVLEEFENHRHGEEIDGARYREPDRDHFRALLEGVVVRQREIDRITDAALAAAWPLANVDPTLRAIFRCGGCELLAMPTVPARVAITEYVDVAKAFFLAQDAPRFVNAVLDAMARRLRPDELPRRDGTASGRDVAS